MAEGAGVDVPELTAIGGSVLEVAGRLERVAAGMRNWAYAAEDAVGGAATCHTATPGAAGRWRGILEHLAAEVRELGAELRRTAESHRDAGPADRPTR
jgi:hypothetical protein